VFENTRLKQVEALALLSGKAASASAFKSALIIIIIITEPHQIYGSRAVDHLRDGFLPKQPHV
jgi:hypothetical protein